MICVDVCYALQIVTGPTRRASNPSFPLSPCFYGTDPLLSSVRERIRVFQIPVTHDSFPRFLWEGERADPQDTNKGFLRGELLVKVLLSMLIGPSAARPDGQSSGKGGYADLLGVLTMTIPSLAFAAIVVG